MSSLEIFKEDAKLVDEALHLFLNGFNAIPQYYDYLRCHFGFKPDLDGGKSENGSLHVLRKRLRPVMCLLIYRAIAGESSDHRPVMPLVLSAEIMHNASLIHDDIQDHDELRWGRPTLWKEFGMEQGINCGDTLQALAYRSVLNLLNEGVADRLVTRILNIGNQVHQMVVEGQYMDLLFEKKLEIPETEYFDMISRKTAIPYAGVAECAALLATQDSDPDLVSYYRQFALKFGMLFQLSDDFLGIWGDLHRTGKRQADIRRKKKTLPVIAAFHRASPESKARLVSLYSNGSVIEEAQVSDVLSILKEAGSRELCLTWIQKFYGETIDALHKTGIANISQDKLAHMADYCLGRCESA